MENRDIGKWTVSESLHKFAAVLIFFMLYYSHSSCSHGGEFPGCSLEVEMR